MSPSTDGPGPDQRPSWAPSTAAVVAGRPHPVPGAALNPPVVLTSTYVATDEATGPGDLVYGRWGNPTWLAFEEALGALEGGTALLYASGLAAIAAVLAEVPSGGHVVAPAGAYGGTLAMLADLQTRGRITVELVAIDDTEAVRSALDRAAATRSAAALLWIETPTNPMLEVADLPALVAAAHAVGARVAVDNTFATPVGQRPLDHGADVVVHSVTKYLAGHSDVVLGAAVTRDGALAARLHAFRTLNGAVPGPFEAWLALRGLRTLHLRVERACANAAILAGRLLGHPALSGVRHPSLPGDPGHARAAAQMTTFGAIIAIEVAAGAQAAELVCSSTRLWVHATSLGGVESTLERRRRHAGEPHLVPETLIRLSVGVEDIEDLWADLEQALRALG